jgi:hypothetical protein
MSRYRPIGSRARRRSGKKWGRSEQACNELSAYKRLYSDPIFTRAPTPPSGQWAITLWAVDDFPPGRHHRFLKYGEYICVALAPPERKIIGGVTHECL